MAIFTNQATLSYNNTTTTSNIVTGELLEVLSATKSALRDEYRYGETITYVISIVNTGTAAFNNLTITDDLGEYAIGAITRTPLTYVTDPSQNRSARQKHPSCWKEYPPACPENTLP